MCECLLVAWMSCHLGGIAVRLQVSQSLSSAWPEGSSAVLLVYNPRAKRRRVFASGFGPSGPPIINTGIAALFEALCQVQLCHGPCYRRG